MTSVALPASAGVRRRFDISRPILAVFAVFLVLLIGLPMAWLIYFSLTDAGGAFSLANFHQVVTNPQFVTPFLTTLTLAISVGLIACAVAAPVGWLVARTDMPLRREVRALVMA